MPIARPTRVDALLAVAVAALVAVAVLTDPGPAGRGALVGADRHEHPSVGPVEEAGVRQTGQVTHR
ncbi:MAG TPA: hypothetical protein VK935_07480 [Actinomycetospora sp.]|nr:hypothetical protein [Actinomycetospora sp.]